MGFQGLCHWPLQLQVRGPLSPLGYLGFLRLFRVLHDPGLWSFRSVVSLGFRVFCPQEAERDDFESSMTVHLGAVQEAEEKLAEQIAILEDARRQLQSMEAGRREHAK